MAAKRTALLGAFDDNEADMGEHRIRRDGDLDLVVRGRVIGRAKKGNAANRDRWTKTTSVMVLLSNSGRVVTAVRQWASSASEASHRAEIHDTPAQALAWLKEDNHGALGSASKEAWEQACRTEPALFAGLGETVVD